MNLISEISNWAPRRKLQKESHKSPEITALEQSINGKIEAHDCTNQVGMFGLKLKLKWAVVRPASRMPMGEYRHAI
jgi:hypothetical protein